MEVARPRERSPLFLAVLALVLTGMALMASTMQALDRQRTAVEEHLLLTARSVHRAVAGLLVKRMMVRVPEQEGFLFRPEAAEYLREIVGSGNVLFVALVDAAGKPLMTLAQEGAPPFSLPPAALAAVTERGEWYGVLPYGKISVFVFGKQIRPAPPPVPWRGGPMMDNMAGWQRFDLPSQTPGVLLVGLDTTEHRAVYLQFRRNALLQGGFILGAALLVLILTLGLMRRKMAASRAATLEMFQSRLLDNLPDGLLTLGPGDTIQAANPAAHAILGVGSGTLVGRTCARIPLGAPDGQRVGWVHHDLDGRRLEILAVPFIGEEGAMNRLVLIRDRTEIRNLEEDLAEAKKLAAVGAMAAGVAHEIRNPLSALRGFAQYFAKKFSGAEPDATYAQTMVIESDRLNRVVTDLLFLARPRPPRPAQADLAVLAGEIAGLLRLDLKQKGIDLEIDMAAPTVWADPDALKQALLNLVLNSLEALEGTMPEPRICVTSSVGHGGVTLRVADNGSGMNAEQVERAFEPFYTGKRHGTGLGLAIVYKTMRDAGGRVSIDSQPGKGTVVSLFFVAGGEEAPVSGDGSAPDEGGGHATAVDH